MTNLDISAVCRWCFTYVSCWLEELQEFTRKNPFRTLPLSASVFINVSAFVRRLLTSSNVCGSVWTAAFRYLHWSPSSRAGSHAPASVEHDKNNQEDTTQLEIKKT